MKIFSPMRDTRRGSQSHMKKRRERREIEMSRRRKRGTQEERDKSMQLSIPRVISVAQTPTKIHPQIWEEKGKRGDRGVLR